MEALPDQKWGRISKLLIDHGNNGQNKLSITISGIFAPCFTVSWVPKQNKAMSQMAKASNTYAFQPSPETKWCLRSNELSSYLAAAAAAVAQVQQTLAKGISPNTVSPQTLRRLRCESWTSAVGKCWLRRPSRRRWRRFCPPPLPHPLLLFCERPSGLLLAAWPGSGERRTPESVAVDW